MPEGDTVHLAARRLHEAFAGRELTRTDFRVPALATVDLAGRQVSDCIARGKHILMRIDPDVTIHSHLKMEGSWHLYRPGRRFRGPAYEVRVVLENAFRVAVGFRLGILEVLHTRREPEVVGHLGPDPLASDWDAAEAVRRVRGAGDRSIAEILLDQTVIAGPGNVYKSEVCFLLGVHPDRPTRSIDPHALVDLVARLLQANRGTGMQITRGDKRPGRRHWVYGRNGQPCYRCGGPIRRMGSKPGRLSEEGAAGQRVTYFCPRCQQGSSRSAGDSQGAVGGITIARGSAGNRTRR